MQAEPQPEPATRALLCLKLDNSCCYACYSCGNNCNVVVKLVQEYHCFFIYYSMCRLRWFGHVERKVGNDWVKCCITWEVEAIRQRGRPKKTWWDCVKNVMESLGLSQKDAQSRNKWRRRIKGQPANPRSPGKMAVKTECVCVYFHSAETVRHEQHVS